MAILFLDRYSQGQFMQLMWLSGPTGNVRTISITFRTVLMSFAVAALFLLSAGFLLHFVGFKIAVEYNPDLARSIGGVTTEAEQKQRKIIGCYSRAVLLSNEVVFCFMPMWEIEKVKRFSEGSDSKWSAWTNWEEEMIKKSVIKRHFKTLVSNAEITEVIEALRIEEENNPLTKSSPKKNMFDFNFEE
jgi:hypothetical protein